MEELRYHRRVKSTAYEKDKTNSMGGAEKFYPRSLAGLKKSDREIHHHLRILNDNRTSSDFTPSAPILDVHSTSCADLSRSESDPIFPEITTTTAPKGVKTDLKNHGTTGSLRISTSQANPIDNKFNSNVGLKNLGNTCFMNSAIQCLVHLEPLVLYFLKGMYRSDINQSSPYKGSLAFCFAELLSEMYSSTLDSVSPINFKKLVTKLAPHLLDYEQQDCQEFLRFLLDGLSEDLKRLDKISRDSRSGNHLIHDNRNEVRPTPPVTLSQRRLSSRTIERIRQMSISTTQESNLTGQEVDKSTHETPVESILDPETIIQDMEVKPQLIAVEDMATFRTLQQKSRLRKSDLPSTDSTDNCLSESQKAWAQYLGNNNSIITDIFGGQLQSLIECSVCHHKSSCFDPFLDISLPLVVGSTKCTLESCLESFSASEILDGDNAFFCEKCKSKQRCVKRLTITKCPSVLVIHIKRFRYTSIRREKMSTEVDFPTANLDMSPYLTPELAEKQNSSSSYLYDLTAVAHHSGTLHGGHYVAHVDTTNVFSSEKRPPNWMCFNDSRVTPTSTATIGGSSAYILFYRLKRSIS